MDIYNTAVVDARYDEFWNDDLPSVAGLSPKPVLVLVAGCEPESTQEQLMMKMLGPGASNLSTGQYNLVRLREDETIPWHKLRDKLGAKFIFMAGVYCGQLGISARFQLNAPNRFDQCIWIPTAPLQQLEQDAEMRKQLWVNGLKKVFADKAYGDF